MLPDRVSNPGPLTYESGALPIARFRKTAFSSRNIIPDKKIRFRFLRPCRHIFEILYEVLLPFSTSTQGINESANFRFLQRLSVIFGFRPDCPLSFGSCQDCCAWEIASCRDCPCDLASCRVV